MSFHDCQVWARVFGECPGLFHEKRRSRRDRDLDPDWRDLNKLKILAGFPMRRGVVDKPPKVAPKGIEDQVLDELDKEYNRRQREGLPPWWDELVMVALAAGAGLLMRKRGLLGPSALGTAERSLPIWLALALGKGVTTFPPPATVFQGDRLRPLF